MLRFTFGFFTLFGVVGGIENTVDITQVQAMIFLFATILGLTSMYFGALKLKNS
jgi:hypothetical protein